MNQKNVIITGAAGYIASAIEDVFAEHGYTLALIDINEDALKKRADELKAKGAVVTCAATDLCDYASVKQAVSDFSKHVDSFDALVTCAGGSARSKIRPFIEQSMDVLHNIIDMNLYGALHILHAVAPIMARNGHGKIVNIGSLVGMQCVPGCLDYGAAKAGVISMTRTLAQELGQYNINVNCVSPGKVQRPNEMPKDPDAFARKYQLLEKLLTGDDIAQLVYFLCSPAADGITGQNYPVCAGRSIGLRGDLLNW